MKYTTVPVDPMMERRRSSSMSVRENAVRVAMEPALRMSTSMLAWSHWMNFLLVRILVVMVVAAVAACCCCWMLVVLLVVAAIVEMAAMDADPPAVPVDYCCLSPSPLVASCKRFASVLFPGRKKISGAIYMSVPLRPQSVEHTPIDKLKRSPELSTCLSPCGRKA